MSEPDIVERLRDPVGIFTLTGMLCKEAADEIEKHRAAANQLRLVAEQQRKEIERLRALAEIGGALTLGPSFAEIKQPAKQVGESKCVYCGKPATNEDRLLRRGSSGFFHDHCDRDASNVTKRAVGT